jgi:septum formation protein
MRVILASASPRRRELLQALVADFEVVASGVEEPWEDDPVANAENLARDKALDVLAKNPGAVIIGADTIVFDESRSYGKPADAGEAEDMWRALRGRPHRVVTGFAVVADGVVQVGSVVSEVELSDLADTAIGDYVASGRPMDKAGAYAIQDEDVPTVRRLDGCYCAVMGLPLWGVKRALEGCGVRCADPVQRLSRCGECSDRDPASSSS